MFEPLTEIQHAVGQKVLCKPLRSVLAWLIKDNVQAETCYSCVGPVMRHNGFSFHQRFHRSSIEHKRETPKVSSTKKEHLYEEPLHHTRTCHAVASFSNSFTRWIIHAPNHNTWTRFTLLSYYQTRIYKPHSWIITPPRLWRTPRPF